jgi:conjugative relaxase-like TrwC/TraI family protein
MLRVTTLYASSAEATAGYYAHYLSQAPGEVPGVWSGAQAAGLGLDGEVGVEALQAALEGRDPVTGTRLGMPLVDRYTKDGALIRAVAGFDATFSAPKSVSVLWALTGDPRVLAVHDEAVRVALAHLERFGATTRVRVNDGRVYPETLGLSMATFRQSTSRADDPQLHAHAVISARVQTEDGRWLALDARYLKRHQRMLGGFYQSALRAGLSQELGVTWGPVVKGQAEIAGMPTELLAALSKRTVEVEAALDDKLAVFRAREGRDPTVRERAAMSREAAVDTRSKKTGAAVEDLTTRWTAEAAALGWDAQRVWSALRNAASRDHTLPQVTTLTGLIDELSTKGSAWSRADIVRAVLDAAPVRPMSPTR